MHQLTSKVIQTLGVWRGFFICLCLVFIFLKGKTATSETAFNIHTAFRTFLSIRVRTKFKLALCYKYLIFDFPINFQHLVMHSSLEYGIDQGLYNTLCCCNFFSRKRVLSYYKDVKHSISGHKMEGRKWKQGVDLLFFLFLCTNHSPLGRTRSTSSPECLSQLALINITTWSWVCSAISLPLISTTWSPSFKRGTQRSACKVKNQSINQSVKQAISNFSP